MTQFLAAVRVLSELVTIIREFKGLTDAAKARLDKAADVLEGVARTEAVHLARSAQAQEVIHKNVVQVRDDVGLVKEVLVEGSKQKL
jgi:hypothetical protein